jgi:hypothetical protein
MDDINNIIGVLSQNSDFLMESKTKKLPSNIIFLIKKTVFEYDMKGFDKKPIDNDEDVVSNIESFFKKRNILINDLTSKYDGNFCF